MGNIKEKYNKENFEETIKNSNTFREVMTKLGLSNKSGNHGTIKKYVKLYNLNIDHFYSQSEFAKIYNSAIKTQIPIEEVLVENSAYSRHSLKSRLYKLKYKKRECELCGQGEIWNGRKMSLILDHINGVNDDNRLENLRIVCANCNATLDTHCGKHLRKSNILKSLEDIKLIEQKKKENIHKGRLKTRTVERPSYEELKKETFKNGFSGTGRKYGVSDNAIRKWIKYYEKYELKLIEKMV